MIRNTFPKRNALTIALAAAFAVAGSPAMAKDVTDVSLGAGQSSPNCRKMRCESGTGHI